MTTWRTIAVILLAFCSPLAAQDQPIIVQEGGFADHTIPLPKGAAVVWRYSPQPIQKAKDLPPGRIIFTGKTGVTYTVTAIVVDFDAKTVTDTDYFFQFGGQIVPPPPKKPPVDPPPPTPTAYYFMVVRLDGPASPAFTKAMSDPAWDAIRVKGHKVKDFTLTDARRLGANIPPGGPLPMVITLREGETTSKVIRSAIPLPANPLTLLEGLP